MIHQVSIVPTITVNDKPSYRTMVEKFNAFTRHVQIDVTDGEFTSANTIDLTNVWWPNDWQADLHFMALRPSEYLDIILKLHPALCILHAEAAEDLLPVFDVLKKNGIRTGVALLPQTYPGSVSQYITAADHVLIFAGSLGKQGAQADMMQTEKIPLIRAIKPDVEIGWDGGANMSNIRALAHAEINVINVGSAISNAENPAEAYHELTTEIDKTGVML